MLVTASFSVFHPNSINTQFTYLSSQIIWFFESCVSTVKLTWIVYLFSIWG
jgi:hypothetical protein